MDSETHPSKSNKKIRIVKRGLEGKVKYCPNCFEELEVDGPYSGWLIPEEYYCKKCGYSGPFALEKEYE